MSASAAEAAGYQIRRATAADHGAVARELAAYLSFLGETLDPLGIDRDIAQWQSAYDGDKGVLLVVIEPGGDVVGTAAVRRLEPGIGEIKRMWIRPAHQGKGLGRPLMDACLAEARATGLPAAAAGQRAEARSRGAPLPHLRVHRGAGL